MTHSQPPVCGQELRSLLEGSHGRLSLTVRPSFRPSYFRYRLLIHTSISITTSKVSGADPGGGSAGSGLSKTYSKTYRFSSIRIVPGQFAPGGRPPSPPQGWGVHGLEKLGLLGQLQVLQCRVSKTCDCPNKPKKPNQKPNNPCNCPNNPNF